MTFEGKTVAITGAASGIGRATALAFTQQGARVSICDLNTVGLAETAQAIQHLGGDVFQVEVDVSNHAQASDAIGNIIKTQGHLDILVNAAGINQSGDSSNGPVIRIKESDWDNILDVNLLGTIYCAQAAGQHMRERRRGCMVNIASIAGAIPRLNNAAYGVSKAGVRMFSKCLALELARYGVRVNAIAPGPTDTPMLGVSAGGEDDPQLRERRISGMPEIFRLGIPLGKLGVPEDVATAICFLASDEANHITGVILNVDGMAQLS
jgi:2,3-dihydro-2,3-dihydroxybenzoate dehydrogenase